jgi:hypothetical protein
LNHEAHEVKERFSRKDAKHAKKFMRLFERDFLWILAKAYGSSGSDHLVETHRAARGRHQARAWHAGAAGTARPIPIRIPLRASRLCERNVLFLRALRELCG